jgi:hypothetical protein
MLRIVVNVRIMVNVKNNDAKNYNDRDDDDNNDDQKYKKYNSALISIV